MTLLEKLRSSGPKRILALDGGGIRGTITLGFLERIEQILRERHGQPDLKLCDYFDLIGGTSTGAIIAAALAIGMEVAEIKKLYLDMGGKIFGKRMLRRWQAYFDAKPLEKALEQTFGDMTLSDTAVKTGLSITVKQADTGLTLLFQNHPDTPHYQELKDYPLWHLIRASTAAPTYFVPEKFSMLGQMAALVDGGVSMANNPALHLFILTTLNGLPFRWPLGEHNILLVSVGTGCWRRHHQASVVLNHKLWNWASEIPAMLMEDANWQNQLMLQGLSHSPTPWEINGSLGLGQIVHESNLFGLEPCLSYLRYNVWLEPEELQTLDLSHLVEKSSHLRELSAAENRFDLALIGEKAAGQRVLERHFPAAFDLPVLTSKSARVKSDTFRMQQV
jgi:uncharacterized protein